MTDEEGLAAAFWAYERALGADDVAELDRWFLDAPSTVRADAECVLTGADAIRQFRRGRGGAPPRIVERLHLRPIGDSVAVAVAETRRQDGGRGLQTQVWVQTPDGWRVNVAHVSATSALADPVWRLRGSPLVAATGQGPLDGVRVAIKDLIAVAGLRIGAGNPRWLSEAAVQRESAPVVEQLLAHGACVAGIAQTDEFAYSLSGTNVHYGTPLNPRAPERIPGGSSSGPASAVALGQAEVGLGTDTAGSIRVPASYLGLHGMRPTHGALSAVGVEPLAPSFDTVGWLAADASTLAAAGRALLPADGVAGEATSLLLASDLLALAEPEVADAVRRAAAQFAEASGMPLREGVSPAGECLDSWFAAFRTVQGAEAHEARGGWVAAHPGAVGPGIATRFAEAAQITVSQRAQAESVVAEARERAREALAGSRTLLVLPATSSVAPRRDQKAEPKAATRAATLRLTCLASIAGVPAVVLPTGKADPPVGLCLVGAAGTDRALLGLVERSAR